MNFLGFFSYFFEYFYVVVYYSNVSVELLVSVVFNVMLKIWFFKKLKWIIFLMKVKVNKGIYICKYKYVDMYIK